MIWTAALLLLSVLSSSGGNLATSKAMKNTGELRDFSFRGLSALLHAAARHPWFWLGAALNALAFFSMLALFSRRDLSFVVPATASSYILGALGSRFLLGERVTALRWLGVLFVGFGVALTVLG